MKVMVFGAGGYLGIPLCHALVTAGHFVQAVDRFFFGKTPDHGDNLHNIRMDIREVTAADCAGFDAVIDLAGLSNDASADIDPELTKQINYVGGTNLATVAKSAGVRRYIYSSSASVYGHGDKMALTETDVCRPLTAYARSKWLVEENLRTLNSNGFEPVILRNATVFGVAPRMRFDLAVNIMTLRAWRSGVIYVMGGGDQWRPFIDLRDLVKVFMWAIDAPAYSVAGETFNVGWDSEQMTVNQLAKAVQAEFQMATIHHIPEDADKRSYHLSFAKLRKVLPSEAHKTVLGGITEVARALRSGEISGDDPTAYTMKYYKSLIEWDKRLTDIKLNGRLL